MKKRFNIVGNTYKNKVLSGKKAQLSKYWYSLIPLVLFCVAFFAFSVFSADPPVDEGYFCMEGDKSCYVPINIRNYAWVHVNGMTVTTPKDKYEYLGEAPAGGEKWSVEGGYPMYVKEDDTLKTMEEAKSLMGKWGFELKWLIDDGVHDFEHVDWNDTSVTFRVKIKDSKQIGKDIPIKKNGQIIETVQLNSLESRSEPITILHEWGNWSFGETSTVVEPTSDDNATFEDAYLYGTDANKANNWGFGNSQLTRYPASTNLFVSRVNVGEVIGSTTATIINFTHFFYGDMDNPAAENGLTFTSLKTEGLWVEGNLTNGLGNCSYLSPNDDYENADETAVWTTGCCGGNYNIKSNELQYEYAVIPTPDDAVYVPVEFNSTFVNLQFQAHNGVIDWAVNLTNPYIGSNLQTNTHTSEGGNKPKYYIEFTTNTAPYIEPIGNVTISPWPEAVWNEDLTCTFNATDEDVGDTLTAYVDWYKNGDVSVQDNMEVSNGVNSTFTLDSGNTALGEKWNCSVRIYDETDYSPWVNSSETEITGAPANKTDFTDTVLQSNNVKDVFVYDASRESWNRTPTDDTTVSWWVVTEKAFPDKTYLFLTEDGLDIFDSSDTASAWMTFTDGNNNAIDGNDFTSVYALDGKVYVGSDNGLHILDFANDNISRYDNTNGLAYYNHQTPFTVRNNGAGYIVHDATKTLASDVVNDINANRVRGEHFVAVATDGSATGAVNIINMDDGSIAELDFCEDPNDYDSENVFIADDGTLYFSENEVSKTAGKTKLSYKYNIDSYTDTDGRGEGYDASAAAKARCDKVGYRSSDFAVRSTSYPYFLSEKINDIYATSYTSRRHTNHNTIYIGTEKGISVVQEFQGDEGIGVSKSYSYTGSSESVDYKVLEGGTDNVTAVTARSDGNALYVGTNNGAGLGSVSKISLNSNTLVESWNTTTDNTIVGNDTTSLDFLDGDLLIGTLDSGATQIVEQELDHYLITEHDKHRIIEIDNTGLIHFEFGVYNTAGSDSTHLNNPTDAVRLTNGNTLIADYGNTRILEVDPDGGVVQEIGNSTQLSDATYLDGVYSVKKV